MFICPDCNAEVTMPSFIPAPPWWRRMRGSSSRPIPTCERGHRLRRQILGNLTELPLAAAFLRGLAVSTLAILLGALRDIRLAGTKWPHLALMAMAATSLVCGAVAFYYAWVWAGLNGPVRRLTTRACGTAFGYAVPVLIVSHGLYFHWLDPVGAACVRGMIHLLEIVQ